MSELPNIRERLLQRNASPEEFQAHAPDDIAYLLYVLEQAAAEIEELDTRLRMRLAGGSALFRRDEDGSLVQVDAPKKTRILS